MSHSMQNMLSESQVSLHIVTGDIKAHQVLLNRVPEQATEDSVKYQILLENLLRITSEWKLQYLHNVTRS